MSGGDAIGALGRVLRAWEARETESSQRATSERAEVGVMVPRPVTLTVPQMAPTPNALPRVQNPWFHPRVQCMALRGEPGGARVMGVWYDAQSSKIVRDYLPPAIVSECG